MKHSEKVDILETVGNALGYALVIAAQNPPSSPEAAKKLNSHIYDAANSPNTHPDVSTVLLSIADAITVSTIQPH